MLSREDRGGRSHGPVFYIKPNSSLDISVNSQTLFWIGWLVGLFFLIVKYKSKIAYKNHS